MNPLNIALYLATLTYLALVILDLSRVYQNRRIREGAFVLVLGLAVIRIISWGAGWATMLYEQPSFPIAELQPPTVPILYEKFGLGTLLIHQDGGFVLAGFVLVMLLVMLFPPAHWRDG